jgi:hypothetical protein
MARKKYARRHLFVDSSVQGRLLLRIAFYWFMCLLTVTLMVLCWAVLTGPRAPAAVILRDTFKTCGPALVASLFLLPMVLVDCNRFSNRFVGPILRFRGALGQLVDGKNVAPIKFRQNDFWHDVADNFNRLLEQMPDRGDRVEPAVSADLPADDIVADAPIETDLPAEPAGVC